MEKGKRKKQFSYLCRSLQRGRRFKGCPRKSDNYGNYLGGTYASESAPITFAFASVYVTFLPKRACVYVYPFLLTHTHCVLLEKGTSRATRSALPLICSGIQPAFSQHSPLLYSTPHHNLDATLMCINTHIRLCKQFVFP